MGQVKIKAKYIVHLTWRIIIYPTRFRPGARASLAMQLRV